MGDEFSTLKQVPLHRFPTAFSPKWRPVYGGEMSASTDAGSDQEERVS
jgi:hypothetical protein